MKRTIRICVSVLLVAGMLFCLAGCGEAGKVRKVISAFQTGCNSKDINAVLDCIDPSISGLVRGGANLLGQLLGEDADAMFTKVSEFLVSNQDPNSVDFFESLKIKVREVSVLDAAATAMCTVTYNAVGGGTTERGATINCKLSGENWYITGFTLN